MIKKILAIALAAMFALSLATTVFAEEEGNKIEILSVTLNDYTDDSGEIDADTIKVDIEFTAPDAMSQLTILMMIEGTSVEDESQIIYINQISAPAAASGIRSFEFLIDKARIKAALKTESIEGCSLSLKLGGTDIDTPASKVEEYTSKTVIIYGDANDDTKVNNRDSARILQYKSDWNVSINLLNADVNLDNKVNNRDAVRILQFLSEWDVKLGEKDN